MALKRRSPKAPSQTSRFTAVLESIEQQNRATLESLHSFRESVDRRLDQMEARFASRFQTLEAAIRDLAVRMSALEARVAALEVAVQRNSEDIRKNSEDIQRMREQLAELTGVVRSKAEASELSLLTERVARLEARVGL